MRQIQMRSVPVWMFAGSVLGGGAGQLIGDVQADRVVPRQIVALHEIRDREECGEAHRCPQLRDYRNAKDD